MIKGLVDDFLRTVEVLYSLLFDPLLNQSEIIAFGHFPVLFLLYPGHQVREQIMVEIASEHAVNYMAEEHFQLDGCAFVAVFRVFAVHLLIYSSYCVPIAHFELCKILVFNIESLLKIRNRFLALLRLLQLLKETV